MRCWRARARAGAPVTRMTPRRDRPPTNESPRHVPATTPRTERPTCGNRPGCRAVSRLCPRCSSSATWARKACPMDRGGHGDCQTGACRAIAASRRPVGRAIRVPQTVPSTGHSCVAMLSRIGGHTWGGTGERPPTVDLRSCLPRLRIWCLGRAGSNPASRTRLRRVERLLRHGAEHLGSGAERPSDRSPPPGGAAPSARARAAATTGPSSTASGCPRRRR
jgi:hypothetical protein